MLYLPFSSVFSEGKRVKHPSWQLTCLYSYVDLGKDRSTAFTAAVATSVAQHTLEGGAEDFSGRVDEVVKDTTGHSGA